MAKTGYHAPLLPGEVVINDKNAHQFINPTVAGEKKKCGTTPRNYTYLPLGSLWCAAEWDLPLLPESELNDRLEQMVKDKAQESNVRDGGKAGQPMPSRDQDGKGYCWNHSGISAMMVGRAAMGEPYADLSAYAAACIIKGFRDEGGWGIEGVKFAAERGCPTSEFWPQQSMAKANDKPETWENAKLHKWTEWRELSNNATERKKQLITSLLLGWPVVSDFNWWSHSVCSVDLVSISPFKTRIWNSWGDSWSAQGMGVLEASKAMPDNAVVCVIATPSTK